MRRGRLRVCTGMRSALGFSPCSSAGTKDWALFTSQAFWILWVSGFMLCTVSAGRPQSPASPSPGQTAHDGTPAPHSTQEPAPPAKGQVLIQSHGEPPSPGQPQGAPATAGAVGTVAGTPGQVPDETAAADITDADRSALRITSYDLDARLVPARAGLSMRARLSVRNEGKTPMKQLALQISSTLHWESATLVAEAVQGPAQPSTHTSLPFAQHRLDTDADHTGAETEIVLPLPQPLPPGGTASLDLFYSGTVPRSAGRLERLGANAAQQEAADWDAIGTAWTGVRGFGNVLWYPVTSPQLFLGDGNTLFQAIGQTRLREGDTTVRLRLSVEYAGTPPAAAYFCGRRQALTSLAEDLDASATSRSGIATGDFAAEPLGFRSLSLFLLDEPEILIPGGDADRSEILPSPSAGQAASQAESSSLNPQSAYNSPSAKEPESAAQTPVPPLQARQHGLNDGPIPTRAAPPFLAVANAGSQSESFAAAADHVAPLLREWLGPQPLSALTAIDHPGQPFQDGPLLVAPLAVLQASSQSGALIQSLTHAWVQTGQPWMDEGLAQFFALLWTEREQGHAAGSAVLDALMRPVALGEPDLAADSGTGSGSPWDARRPPLYASSDDLIYRRKGAAVWWMLRGIVGDGDLHAALGAWCTQVRSEPAAASPNLPPDSPEQQAVAFEHLLERLSKQDLRWFFADWVLRDRGLPDLTITDVAVAPVPAGAGHTAGWLVAVTVRNEGGAVADVPLVVRSGVGETARRLRVAGRSSVTQRVLVETAPTTVVVNDGSTPEVRESTHTRAINLTVR